MSALDHIALLTASLDDARRSLADLELAPQPVQSFAAEGTRECYLGAPERAGRILLVEPAGEGPYADAMKRRGPGLHHVALTVDDLDTFVAEVVTESGWLLHPRSFETRHTSNTIWLARPGVQALIECHEGEAKQRGRLAADQVTIAGLDIRDGLADIFEDSGVDVVAGPRSGVTVAGRFIGSTESAGAGRDLSDAYEYNRQAWNRKVQAGNRWTVGVDSDEVERARGGQVDIVLTPTKHVPAEWLGELDGADVLCLASGGGQQGPLLAAAGANVTVFDASDEQLQRDRDVAEREGLELRTMRGDMRDLGEFDDACFDLIVHPCSNSFVAEILPVWREAYRVLRPGGELLSGFTNPISYCFDWASVERGDPQIRYRLPYRDLDHLDSPFVARSLADGEALEFSHTLEDQLGGQIDAGFAIVGYYADPWGSGEFPDAYFDGFIATRAKK